MNRACLGLGLLLTLLPALALASPAYRQANATALGSPDRWDYVVFNAQAGRVYAAHGDRLTVIDAHTGAVVGQVLGIAGGAHGSGISVNTGQGFTDDGANGFAVVYDLQTLAVKQRIVTDKDADGIAVDNKTGNIFVIEGDSAAISVIDPKSNTVISTIKTGEKMEYAAADDAGALFVAGEEKRDILKIDTASNTVRARWSTPDCASPHGLALDPKNHRLFMGCVNMTMMVVDTADGHVVARLPIGRGSDAVAFDPQRKRVFSSNGLDGTITAYQQVDADTYEALEPIKTAVSGRTMDVDPATGRLFVLAADVDPPAVAGGRPRPRAGTLRMMMFDPVPDQKE